MIYMILTNVKVGLMKPTCQINRISPKFLIITKVNLLVFNHPQLDELTLLMLLPADESVSF